MSFRITPILSKECPSIGWKISPSQSSGENLKSLLTKIEKKCKKVKDQSLSIEKEKTERKTLEKVTKELGANIASLLALAEVSKKESFSDTEKLISKKTTEQLTRDLLELLKNSEAIWNKSTDYEEAWREIEAEYFYKVSLYQMELHKRT